MSSCFVDGWADREPRHDPFRWLSFEPGTLLVPDRLGRLWETLPTDGFRRVDASRREHDKTYRNSTRVLAHPDGCVDRSLPRPWAELVDELLAPEYRAAIGRLLDVPVCHSVEIRLNRYHPGDWLGPHTDREDKLFSHVVYLTPGWRREWGGGLEILRDHRPQSRVAEVVPTQGAAALLRRSASSWHQVAPVRAIGAPQRCSILVHGLEPS